MLEPIDKQVDFTGKYRGAQCAGENLAPYFANFLAENAKDAEL